MISTYSVPVKPGILEVFCGPMKSGKTKWLLERVDKLNFMHNCDFIFIKPSTDTRDKNIKSRYCDTTYECAFVENNKPEKILESVEKRHAVVLIDEAQFFTEGFERVVEKLLLMDKNVIVAGLDLDFRGNPFGTMPILVSMANEVHKLTAVCDCENCNSPATRTQRLINGKAAHYDSETIVVGDAEAGYQTRCLKHHDVPGKPGI